MTLTRHASDSGFTWRLDGKALPDGVTLGRLLQMGRAQMLEILASQSRDSPIESDVVSPVEADQEVWAAGVTYLRSRVEREAESTVADVYSRVYEAERPELFFKSVGWRTVGHGATIRIRRDSTWNVPEPELTLVINSNMEIVGYSAGNDVSSRSIEGENPLYLPQAKTYDGACAVGPAIVLAAEADLSDLEISVSIVRDGNTVFTGEARTSQMKRSFSDLVEFLGRETSFPKGVFLMTGTGIVPGQDFTMLPGDVVTVMVGELQLVNTVSQ